MSAVITIAQIFKYAGLTPCGPKSWQTPISVHSAGVYVIALVPDPTARLEGPVYAEYLDVRERERWLCEQPIIYIGQTTRQTLAKRLSQFYRHQYGKRAPHRGGQAVMLLKCDRWVYWSLTANPRDAERIMIAEFKRAVGQTPFANHP